MVLGGGAGPGSSQVRPSVAGKPECAQMPRQAQGPGSGEWHRAGTPPWPGQIKQVPHPAHSLAGTEGSKVGCRSRASGSSQELGKEVGGTAGQDPRCRAHACPGSQLLMPCLSVGHRGLKRRLPGQGTGAGGSDPANRVPAWSEPSSRRRPSIVGACFYLTAFLPGAG